MSALVPEPLPECMLCEMPTRRATYTSNGGLCTQCAQGMLRTVDMLPPVLPLDS